jgi:hypothetical protein
MTKLRLRDTGVVSQRFVGYVLPRRTNASPLFPLAGERSSEFVARFHPRATNVRGRT